ncbi:MAG: hypothetical protein DLM65_12360 [Candidatus Aeolococcus gillhamiae]|uniref:Single-stranded DNA-binding protein n=1 Tax=Candidatus Aeolococcus gillhamiae TaxID=3127015 RepID=A0A2W5Z3F2_9BACT|nr:MAG: hypothetical protein DLM65_12360 [Candidatus Dormibacter sp. RRmetagenome_bin12]
MNTVHLIGLVGCRPRAVGSVGDKGFVLLTLADATARRVDRHRVIVAAHSSADIGNFTPGESVYVEGRLGRSGEGGRVAVIAAQAWSILPAPPPPADAAAAGSHASPREHLRRGHARRIAIGTPRERLIWVRPTTAGPAGHSNRH